MKIKFESSQDYQLSAIQAVIDIFEGQPLASGNFETSFVIKNSSIAFTEKGIANNLLVSEAQILQNVKSIQLRNNIPISKNLVVSVSDDNEIEHSRLNFTIEMETGTGKTYTFLRSIYKLNEIYGFKKFVIVVPGIAIREGAIKNLEVTYDHFQELYDNPPINFNLYDSKNLVPLRNFSVSNAIEILVINIDSFTKDNNVINNTRETGIKPIEYIQATNPIVIIDEPQNMETEIRRTAIGNLKSLCTLRFSATHKNFYNLIYSLNPVQAYDLGLVKQIEVDGVTANSDFNTPFIKLLNFEQNKNSIKAKITIHAQSLFDVKEKTVSANVGSDLFELSGGREIYRDGYILNDIKIINGKCKIEFSNSITLNQDEEIGRKSDQLIKYQIERTIYHHFEKEVQYIKKFGTHAPIKVLSLFFIDKVSNYREYDESGNPLKGKFALWFEEIFEKYVLKYKPLYPDLFNPAPPEAYFETSGVHETDIPSLHPDYWNANRSHNGYFSKDRKGTFKDTKGTSQDDEDTYSLIMRDKERLLSLNEPLRFIFSHSALREGWDNPNIFQICTLNESKSELKKRQEIGRGLRLCVDGSGNQIRDKRINILTVIANETYEAFSSSLQKEIMDETSVDFSSRVKNANDKLKVKLSKEITEDNFPLLFDIWDKISQQTKYQVKYDSDKLVEKILQDLESYNIIPFTRKPLIESKSALLNFTGSGIESRLSETAIKYADAETYLIPDIYYYIQSRIDITRNTIFQILSRTNRLSELQTNPQMFLDNIINSIRRNLNKLLVEGLKYEEISGLKYKMTLFKFDEVENYLANLFEVSKPEKTLYNYIPVESEIENQFAKDCESDEKVKFFFKLPRGFKIPTPMGNYNPDWAIVFQNNIKVYFVAETKGTLDRQSLRELEKMKIECGEKHFALFKPSGVEYHLAVTSRDLY